MWGVERYAVWYFFGREYVAIMHLYCTICICPCMNLCKDREALDCRWRHSNAMQCSVTVTTGCGFILFRILSVFWKEIVNSFCVCVFYICLLTQLPIVKKNMQEPTKVCNVKEIWNLNNFSIEVFNYIIISAV